MQALLEELERRGMAVEKIGIKASEPGDAGRKLSRLLGRPVGPGSP